MRKYRLGYSLEEYKKKIESGEWQAHKFSSGFLITEIRQFQEEKILIVHFMGGEQLDAWKSEAADKVIKFGLSNGCLAIEATCRLGLEKRMKEFGYRRHRVVMRKELNAK